MKYPVAAVIMFSILGFLSAELTAPKAEEKSSPVMKAKAEPTPTAKVPVSS